MGSDWGAWGLASEARSMAPSCCMMAFIWGLKCLEVRPRGVNHLHALACCCTSFVHSFIHSFIQAFMHACIHSFIHSFVHSFVHYSCHALSRPTINSFVRFVQWPTPQAPPCCSKATLFPHALPPTTLPGGPAPRPKACVILTQVQ